MYIYLKWVIIILSICFTQYKRWLTKWNNGLSTKFFKISTHHFSLIIIICPHQVRVIFATNYILIVLTS